jgi:16S rRNA (uracil1498-N3)-methyltransferase
MLHDVSLMRTIRIYSPQKLTAATSAELTGTAARHIAQVLRLGAGDPLILFDGSGDEFPALIETATKTRITVTLKEARTPVSESALRISLWHGLCRSSRMDSIVQKATELGVAEIQPVLTEHGVVRLDAKRSMKKTEHWLNIAISACEQSGRVLIPSINEPRTLADCLTGFQSNIDKSVIAIMCDPDGAAGIDRYLSPGQNTLLLTGPEGGFSQKEKEAAVAAGFNLVSLGPRILRTETAPVTALSLIQHLAGDLGSQS